MSIALLIGVLLAALTNMPVVTWSEGNQGNSYKHLNNEQRKNSKSESPGKASDSLFEDGNEVCSLIEAQLHDYARPKKRERGSQCSAPPNTAREQRSRSHDFCWLD